MKPEDLIIKHYSIGNRCPMGFSSWWLGRADKTDQKFHSDKKLQKLFDTVSPRGGLQVESRGVNHRIILLNVGTSKAVRQKFLSAVANEL